MEQQVKKSIFKKWWFWLIVVIIVFGIVGASGSPSSNVNVPSATNTQPVAQQEQAIKVSATQLVSDYEANEVSADGKYKGKLVEVNGTIKSIGKDILDTPYVALAGNSPTIFTDVQCMFDKSDQDQLASLSKDKKITLQGKVNGKLGNVLINGCSIVK